MRPRTIAAMTAAILLSIAVAAIANAQARARLHVFAPNAAKEDVALARKTVFLELLCLGAAALAAQAWKKRKADVDDASRKRRPWAFWAWVRLHREGNQPAGDRDGGDGVGESPGDHRGRRLRAGDTPSYAQPQAAIQQPSELRPGRTVAIRRTRGIASVAGDSRIERCVCSSFVDRSSDSSLADVFRGAGDEP